jgi:hypothetical protein
LVEAGEGGVEPFGSRLKSPLGGCQTTAIGRSESNPMRRNLARVSAGVLNLPGIGNPPQDGFGRLDVAVRERHPVDVMIPRFIPEGVDVVREVAECRVPRLTHQLRVGLRKRVELENRVRPFADEVRRDRSPRLQPHQRVEAAMEVEHLLLRRRPAFEREAERVGVDPVGPLRQGPKSACRGRFLSHRLAQVDQDGGDFVVGEQAQAAVARDADQRNPEVGAHRPAECAERSEFDVRKIDIGADDGVNDGAHRPRGRASPSVARLRRRRGPRAAG